MSRQRRWDWLKLNRSERQPVLPKRSKSSRLSRPLRYEQLEDRRLLTSGALIGTGYIPQDEATVFPMIVNGTVTNSYPEVGIVSSNMGLCTGTLVTPRHVLTAAHCLTVSGAMSFVIDGQVVPVLSRVAYPGFPVGSSNVHPNDLAILTLAYDVTDVAPRSILRTPPTVGETLTLVGYGLGGTTNNPGTSSGTKRVGTSRLDFVQPLEISIHFNNNGESSLASGDSGAPWYVTRNGTLVIAGVHSYGAFDNGENAWTPGADAAATRVDPYRAWIDANTVGPEVTVFEMPSNTPVLDSSSLIVFAGNAGTSVTKTFTVRNDGATQMTLGALNVPEGYAIIDDLVSTLQPGQFDQFTVQISSVPFSQSIGAISFDTNDDDEDLFAFSALSHVLGSDIVVDSAEDVINHDPGIGQLTLREAVAVATKLASASPVTPPRIVFSPTLNRQQVTLSLGQIDVAASMQILGPGANLMTLIARDPTPTQNNSDGSRHFLVDDGNELTQKNVLISGLTLSGGDPSDGSSGGSIKNEEKLTVKQSVFSDNAAVNLASGVRAGGAIHNGRTGTLTVMDSRLSGNHTTGTSSRGGGAIESLGELSIIDTVIAGNSTSTRGGGVSANEGSLIILRSTIDGNIATSHGGGIFVAPLVSSVLIQDSTLSSNTTGGDGGGARFEIGAGQTRWVENSTISENQAKGDAGGLQFWSAPNSIRRLWHSTVTRNRADSDSNNDGSGGGVGGFPDLSHTVVAGNSGPLPDIDGIVTAAYSLIGNNSGSNLAATPHGVPDVLGNLVGPWYFQSSFLVEVDLAAMGDFEAGASGDNYKFEYRIDGAGAWQPLFDIVVDENASMTYTLANGTTVSLDDPLRVDGELLNNAFNASSRFSTVIPHPGASVAVRFTASTDGANEAFAWRNLTVARILPDGTSTTIGRTVQSTASNDLITSYSAPNPLDDGVSGDMFGIRSRSQPGALGLPTAIADDSAGLFPADVQGIIRESDPARFFGVVDTVNGVGGDSNQAEWTFTNFTAPIDPRLGDLRDNGGPTFTHDLLDDSPAIDAGSSDFEGPPLRDQRGTLYPRLADGDADSISRVDIGAVEQQNLVLPFPLIVDTLADELDFDYSPGDLSLREAINLANHTAGVDSITFAPVLADGTIRLSRGELVLTEAATIDGGGVNLTIDAQQISRIYKYEAFSGVLAINALTLTGGNAEGVTERGGAIYADGNLEISNSAIHGNRSQGGGGGVWVNGSFVLFNSSVSDNHAFGEFSNNEGYADGGGINAEGSVVIENSVVSGNTATFSGGGIFAFDASAFTVVNSTISGNSARISGGGAFINRFGLGSITVRHTTVTDNHVEIGSLGEGGGIWARNDELEITNSIIAGNSHHLSNPDLEVSDDLGRLQISHSLIGNTSGSIIQNATGIGIFLNVSALLGPLADNGGPTKTHSLLPGSPAINAGDPTYAGPISTDQRGIQFARVASGRIDMGAFEVQPMPLEGDYDRNGFVQQSDHTFWVQHFGQSTGISLQADGNSNGIVDAADYSIWRDAFAASSAASVAAGAFTTSASGSASETYVATFLAEVTGGEVDTTRLATAASIPPIQASSLFDPERARVSESLQVSHRVRPIDNAFADGQQDSWLPRGRHSALTTVERGKSYVSKHLGAELIDNQHLETSATQEAFASLDTEALGLEPKLFGRNQTRIKIRR